VNTEELQKSIIQLAEFPPTPEADWVAKINASPTEVIVGAILQWVGRVGVTMGPDPLSSRREAAQALLHARLSTQISDAATRLHATIGTYQQQSTRQTESMLRLTWVIAVLTGIMLFAVVVQIVLVLRAK
jgi:hypothetical protein